MVCLKCTMLSIFFWLQIIFCSCTNETKLFSFLRSLLHENGRLLCFPKIFFGKLCKLADQYYLTQHSALANIDLLTTDKSQYFCSTSFNNCYYFLLRLGGRAIETGNQQALKLIACSCAGVFWLGETLFVFKILWQPPSLIS